MVGCGVGTGVGRLVVGFNVGTPVGTADDSTVGVSVSPLFPLGGGPPIVTGGIVDVASTDGCGDGVPKEVGGAREVREVGGAVLVTGKWK